MGGPLAEVSPQHWEGPTTVSASAPPAAAPPVGRPDEVAAAEAFLAARPDGARVLLLEGNPGIGKTTIWRHVTRRAAARGMTVLSCRAVPAEATLAFVALADLLGVVAAPMFEMLPPPQRVALEVALLRAVPPETAVDPRAVGAGVVSVLSRLDEDAPLLVAVDDAQWLDRASANALQFVMRRVADRRVLVVLTMRTAASDPLGVEHAFGERVDRRVLAPLGLAALDELVRLRAGRPVPRSTLKRVLEVSRGNPMFALEIVHALNGSADRPNAAAPLPVPERLSALVAERVRQLPLPAREALLVAAALPTPTSAMIERAVAAPATALNDAVAAGLVEVHGDRVRFAHPLYASAVYTSASPERRRALHHRLGELTTDLEERAHHVALAAEGPDERAAALLDAAADRARERGAPGVAGDLQSWAARLTPAGLRTDRRGRELRAAQHWYRAGDLRDARRLLESLRAGTDDGALRNKILWLLGELRSKEDSFTDAAVLLEEALQGARGKTAVTIRLSLAFVRFSMGDVAGALAAAQEALAHAELLHAEPLLAEALAVHANVGFFLGRGLDGAAITRAVEMEDRTRDVQLQVRPSVIAALGTLYEGRLAEASARLRALRDWVADRGEESDCILLAWLSWTEIARGNFVAGERLAEEGLSLAAQAGSAALRGIALVHRGRARAFMGSVEPAREDLRKGASVLERTGWAQVHAWAQWTLGFLELSVGDHQAAVHVLGPYVAAVEARGLAEPFAAPFLPDAVEALIVRGELDRAEAVLSLLSNRARALGRVSAMAEAQRCSALLHGARGDLDGAREAVRLALCTAEMAEGRFERARARLALGQIERRLRHKRAAREALEQALAGFQELGATLWAERTKGELSRTGGRVAPGELTATEGRVAGLAAAGHTNREIAHALFVSPKTVESNLARVYRKLAIGSRAELGRVMAERPR